MYITQKLGWIQASDPPAPLERKRRPAGAEKMTSADGIGEKKLELLVGVYLSIYTCICMYIQMYIYILYIYIDR